MTRSVVITGVGAVTPLGVGARTLHERWTAGVSGIEDGFGRASEFEPTEHLSVKEVRRSDRFTQLALAAAREALEEFGAEPDQINPDATFESLDIDSLDLVELAQIVEDEYGVELKGDDMEGVKTVRQAVDLVMSKLG